MKVKEVMTTEVAFVGTQAPIREIVGLMADRKVGGLPVASEQGAVLGVITERDLILRAHRDKPVAVPVPVPSRGARPDEFARRVDAKVAGELMTTPAITVDEDVDLRVAARLMSSKSVGRLPVTRKGKLVGIVSRCDVVRVFTRGDEQIRAEILEVLASKLFNHDPRVHVEVQDGVVHLSGRVKRRSIAREIAFHVNRVDGVTAIADELDYDVDDS